MLVSFVIIIYYMLFRSKLVQFMIYIANWKRASSKSVKWMFSTEVY